MGKVTTQQSNFSNGEISPLAMGRSDIAKYANSVKIMENFLINQLGGGLYRPGTRYVASTKDNGAARLMPFQYSADQDYVMELGDLYARFYNNDASTVTLTTWGNRVMLMHFDGTDTSTTMTDELGHTVTAIANAQLDTAQKVFGTASLKLDGTGDWLTITSGFSDFAMGTGDFTVKMRIMWDTAVASCYFFSVDNTELAVKFEDTTPGMEIHLNSSQYNFSWNPSADTWYTLEVSRASNKLKVFIDGTQLDTGQTAADVVEVGTAARIGARTDDHTPFKGWIDEFTVFKGEAEHSANYTVETTPYAITSSSELVTTYLEADLFELMQAHKNDVKYITHEDYIPRKTSRTSATAFAIADVDFVRGPFLDTNITAVTLNPDGATGDDIGVVASAATFDATHVGSLWRIKDGVIKITAVTNSTTVVADVQAEPDGTAGDLNGTAAVTDWAEGAFSGYRGYPKACAFHDGCLYYGGTTHEPQKIWKSVAYAYDNFNTDDASADDAATFEIATEERVAIQWLTSAKKSLSIGTSGGTFSASGASAGPIIPGGIEITRDTNYGAALLPPKRISSFIYYVQRTLNSLREISYNYDIDSKIARDMNLLSEHILRDGDGVIQLDHQQSPNDRIWCVRDDGQLSVLTRNPEQEITGWARVVAGEDSQGDGEFESLVVIPKQDADDQIWVVVKRVINGTTKRFLEYFTAEIFDEDWDAVRVDSAVTMDSPITITGATKADPVVVTAGTHGRSNGDQVKINGVVGMTELNGEVFLVANKTDDTFELTDTASADIDGSAYSTYISGGEVREMTTAITGLGHMEGEAVYVQADGVALTATYTVASGAITLATKAAVTHVGFKYDGTIQLLKFSDGSATGTGQTKNRRVYLSSIRVNRSLHMKIGKDEDNLDEVFFGATNATTVTDLFTGDLEKFFKTGWAKDDEIILRQDKPNPLNILSIITRSEVTD